MGKTVYQKPAKREEAPEKADCLTAIHYLFKQALRVDIPLTYIGDMPRRLVASSEWRPLVIRREEAQPGDLLFVKNVGRPKMLSHVAVFMGPQSLFHCSPDKKTAVIEEYGEFSQSYEQYLPFRKAVRYIDPRNRVERAQQGGLFILDGV